MSGLGGFPSLGNLGCMLGIVVACATQSIVQAQQYVPSHIHGSIPPDPRNGLKGDLNARELDAGERAMVSSMIEAASFYVADHPDLIPAFAAFRDCFWLNRMRIGAVDTDWYTLPDVVRSDGRRDVWLPPGASLPNGQVLPPNTVIIKPGEVGPKPGSIDPANQDPSRHCWNRALAILVVLHEGMRQLQVGIMEADVKDCNFISSAIRVFALDIRVLKDLRDNRVPQPGPTPNAPWVKCDIEQVFLPKVESQIKFAEDRIEDLCFEANFHHCQPKPPECQ